MKIAKGILGGTLLGVLSFNALGAVVVGPYSFGESALVDQVLSYSGGPAGMDNGTSWVNPVTSTELTDTNAGTFLATNSTTGYNNITLGMRFNQVNVVDAPGAADIALFFMFDQTSNNVGFSVNGTDFQDLLFSVVSKPPQQVVNNVQWDGNTLQQVELMVAEVDLNDFGVSSLNEFTLSMGQTTDVGVVALSMVGAINSVPVPVPAAVWLFGSGLVGLAGIARKRA
jgi:hypothetical protein